MAEEPKPTEPPKTVRIPHYSAAQLRAATAGLASQPVYATVEQGDGTVTLADITNITATPFGMVLRVKERE
jgi:hypothetical protein